MTTAGEAQGFRATSSAIGYAINSVSALAVVNQVRSGQASADVVIGPVGYMGISVRDLDCQLAAQYNLNLTSGALVWAVQTGSPAELAGITPLSVITKVGGTSIDSTHTLRQTLHTYKPGPTGPRTRSHHAGAPPPKPPTLVSAPNL